MRCSVSPWLRASVVCMLMQLAQPLICEERIFTSSIRHGSRLAAIASEAPIQAFMTSGAAVRTLSLAVIGPSFRGFRCDDEPGTPDCDIAPKKIAPLGFIPARHGGQRAVCGLESGFLQGGDDLLAVLGIAEQRPESSDVEERIEPAHVGGGAL